MIVRRFRMVARGRMDLADAMKKKVTKDEKRGFRLGLSDTG